MCGVINIANDIEFKLHRLVEENLDMDFNELIEMAYEFYKQGMDYDRIYEITTRTINKEQFLNINQRGHK